LLLRAPTWRGSRNRTGSDEDGEGARDLPILGSSDRVRLTKRPQIGMIG